jgi:glutaminyl-peptide cyclotransferase
MPVSGGAIEVKFDQKRAWEYLTKQVDFGPRAPGSEGHLKCRDYLKAELEKTCENVRLQPFTHRWSKTRNPVQMWNILGEMNYQKAKTRVVLLAHWDTRPSADMEAEESKRGLPILGANDGASGVAVLLELMNALKGRLPADVGILVFLTDGEDLGPSLDEMFLGATHFAKNLPTPKPDYGILLDMIGDKDLRVPMERNSYFYARPLMNAIYAHAKSVGLEKTFPNEMGQWISDDHIPLNEAGLRTIDLIDFTYEPWHTLNDTVDKCAPESLFKVGKLLETWMLKSPSFRFL